MNKRSIVSLLMIMIYSWSCGKTISFSVTPTSLHEDKVQTVEALDNNLLPPDITANPPADESCWPIVPLHLKKSIPGKLLFFDPDMNEKNNLIVWDISSQTFENLSLPANIISGPWSVSADGKVLSIFSEQNLLQISDGAIEAIPFPETDAFDRQNLVANYPSTGRNGRIVYLAPVSTGDFEGSGHTNQPFEVSYFVLDPIQKLFMEKNVTLADIHIQENRLPPIYFSPDMKYVLYENGSRADGNIHFSIVDLANNETILRFPSESDPFTTTNGLPHWLPGENKVSAELYNQETGERDYYVISLDGKITKTISAKEMDGYSSANLRNPRMDWSPDMNYLAIVDIHNNLGIWEDQAKKLYQTCFPGKELPTDPIQPNWSFDGNYFQLSIRTVSQEEVINSSGKTVSIEKSTVRYYIVDIAGKVIYELPEDLSDASKTGSLISWVNW